MNWLLSHGSSTPGDYTMRLIRTGKQPHWVLLIRTTGDILIINPDWEDGCYPVHYYINATGSMTDGYTATFNTAITVWLNLENSGKQLLPIFPQNFIRHKNSTFFLHRTGERVMFSLSKPLSKFVTNVIFESKAVILMLFSESGTAFINSIAFLMDCFVI